MKPTAVFGSIGALFSFVILAAVQAPPSSTTTSTIAATTGTATVIKAPRATVVSGAPTPRPTPIPLTTEELDKLILPANHPEDLSNSFALFFSGYRRSQLEPCGCIAKQLGGIDKEGRLIKRTAEMDIPTVEVDAGGFMKDMPNENILLQTEHLLKALSIIKYDAINVSFTDVGSGVKFLKDLQSSYTLPFISANLVDQTSSTIFEPYRVIPVQTKSGEKIRVGIIGVSRPRTNPAAARNVHSALSSAPTLAMSNGCIEWISRDAAEYIERAKGLGAESTPVGSEESYSFSDPEAALKENLPELRKKADFIVLLDYQTKEDATNLVKSLGPSAGIDVIVVGEYVSMLMKGTAVGNAKLVTSGYEGKHVGMMLVDTRGGKAINTYEHMIEVGQGIPSVPELTKVIEEYKAATANLSTAKAALHTSAINGKISFAGSQACIKCHQTEFNQWKTTKHAMAMKTLIEHNSQFNPDCLRCHTTGYMVDNGFKDYRITPQMGDVQCEVCHGPAFQHVLEKRRAEIAVQMGKPTPTPSANHVALKTEFDEKFCSKCHDRENDNKFMFSRDITLIDHSKIAQRPADAPITRETSGTASTEKVM